MKDIYGNEYELYSGKVYIMKTKDFGNVAVYLPHRKENNGLYVIHYGRLRKDGILDKKSIENAVVSMGWRLEDWL